jgi:hypothetical protein
MVSRLKPIERAVALMLETQKPKGARVTYSVPDCPPADSLHRGSYRKQLVDHRSWIPGQELTSGRETERGRARGLANVPTGRSPPTREIWVAGPGIRLRGARVPVG